MLSVNIRDFPEELHYRAKIQAAREKITLRELIIRAVTEYLQKRGEQNGNVSIQ